jgi:hypothetical protein
LRQWVYMLSLLRAMPPFRLAFGFNVFGQRARRLRVLESGLRPTNAFLAARLRQQSEVKHEALRVVLGEYIVEAPADNPCIVALVLPHMACPPDSAWYARATAIVNEQLKDIVFDSVRTEDSSKLPSRNAMGCFRLRIDQCGFLDERLEQPPASALPDAVKIPFESRAFRGRHPQNLSGCTSRGSRPPPRRSLRRSMCTRRRRVELVATAVVRVPQTTIFRQLENECRIQH